MQRILAHSLFLRNVREAIPCLLCGENWQRISKQLVHPPPDLPRLFPRLPVLHPLGGVGHRLPPPTPNEVLNLPLKR